MRKAIAIDFDGCLCEASWPEIGRPRMEVIDAALSAQKQGAALILWTCRSGPLLADAIRFCKEYGLEFDAVNENLPERIAYYGTDCRKVNADEYWDDHAVHMPTGAVPPNDPISMEKLREMDGDPVWVHLIAWALVRIEAAPISGELCPQFVFSDGSAVSARDCYDAGFVAYRRRKEAPA